MKLYWLRHGIAADRESWQGSDADRPLTPEGRKNMQREAKGMQSLDLRLDLIVTSPLRRAKETAQFVADRLKLKLVEDERLADLNREGLAQLLRDHRDAESVLIVGHEPDFSEVVGEVIGSARIDFKKGALARTDIDLTTMHGELLWLIPPKALML